MITSFFHGRLSIQLRSPSFSLGVSLFVDANSVACSNRVSRVYSTNVFPAEEALQSASSALSFKWHRRS